MIKQVVIKLNRLCDLKCTYCYYINEDTLNYGSRIKMEMVNIFLDKYTKYCIEKGALGHIALHGGEPLLMGYEFLEKVLSHPGIGSGIIRPSLQTNGQLMNLKFATLFKEKNCKIGVSVDGPKWINDKYRKSKKGNGSYDKAINAITILKEVGIEPSILSVIHEEVSGKEALKNFVEIGINRIDFLPPICNYSNLRQYSINLKKIETFLLEALCYWIELDDPSVRIRLFDELVNKYTNVSNGYFATGTFEWENVAILEVDGQIAPLEEIYEIDKIDKENRYFTGLNIAEHSLYEIEGFMNKFWEGIPFSKQLPTICSSCKMNDMCGGGNIASRYDEDGSFDNPGIHCNSFFQLSTMLKKLVATQQNNFLGSIINN